MAELFTDFNSLYLHEVLIEIEEEYYRNEFASDTLYTLIEKIENEAFEENYHIHDYLVKERQIFVTRLDVLRDVYRNLKFLISFE